MYCKNCGVELEDDMPACPLCGEPVMNNDPGSTSLSKERHASLHTNPKMTQPQKKFVWEIVSLILLCGAIVTFIVDFIISGRITWSEYPAAICLMIFCYVSLFAFLNRARLVKIAGGFFLSSLCLVILDFLTGRFQWSIKLGIPLLFVSNLVVAVMIAIIERTKYKGINLIAYAFIGAALLCLSADGILSLYKNELFRIRWSAIVAICVMPVVVMLLFTHFRLKKGRSLEKTFHI